MHSHPSSLPHLNSQPSSAMERPVKVKGNPSLRPPMPASIHVGVTTAAVPLAPFHHPHSHPHPQGYTHPTTSTPYMTTLGHTNHGALVAPPMGAHFASPPSALVGQKDPIRVMFHSQAPSQPQPPSHAYTSLHHIPAQSNPSGTMPSAARSQAMTRPSKRAAQTSRRPYPCSYPGCAKSFSQQGNLQTHTRKHTGERPFQCSYKGCEKTFTQLGNLKTHEKIHWDVKPYLCDFPGCDKRFTQRGNLKTHQIKLHQMEL